VGVGMEGADTGVQLLLPYLRIEGSLILIGNA